MKNTLLLILSVTTLLNAQSLKTSLEDVISTNPIILERLSNYNSVKEEITAAKSGYYPKLDLSLGVGYEKTDRDNTSFDFKVYQNSLKYTQNVFNGFETTYRVQQQKSKTLSSAYSYIEKVNSTSFDLVNSYLQVMKNHELLQTAKENVEINQIVLIKVEKLYKAGLTTLSEVNKIKASLYLAKSNYVVQENTLLDAQYSLQKTLGKDINNSYMSRPQLNVELPLTIQEAQEFALKNNPSLLISEYNIKLSKASYKEKKAAYYPKIDLEVSQTLNHNLNAIQGDENRFRAMAYVKYNLFNGFSDKSSIQKGISKIQQEKESKDTIRRDIIEELKLSYSAYEKLTDQLKHLQSYKEFSHQTLQLYTKEYDLGRRSLLDLLSAQNDFIGSKSQIINTEYNLLFAKYRIIDSMGILVSSVINNNDIHYTNVGLKDLVTNNTN